MNLCSAGHDQVCYDDGVSCPVCQMEHDKDNEISELKDTIAQLENQVTTLENERDDAIAEAQELKGEE